MKSSLTAAITLAAALPAATLAFAPPAAHQQRCASLSSLRATVTADELSSKSKEEQFQILGVEEEKLALGIDADEVLQFLGTREDLVSKFQTDIPTLSPTDLQTEVDKFLMDGEMLDIFIKYNQRKAEDPDWEPLYAPENNSPFRKAVDFVSQYGFYVVLGVLAKDIIDGYIQKGGDGGAAGAGGEVVDTLVSQVHQITTTLSA
mmetsp:Transcript_498/g.810  ORF Transcript_498/g.810 Transcript_498/m.810 type:complete len:204 (+) Transcript_498:19-630(+)